MLHTFSTAGTVTSRRREREHVAKSPVLTEFGLGKKNWALSERVNETFRK